MTALDDMARRAEIDPFFLGFALARYAGAHGLGGAGMCGLLGCDRERLRKLKLCRNPRRDAEGFLADARRVAGACGCDEAALMKILLWESES